MVHLLAFIGGVATGIGIAILLVYVAFHKVMYDEE